MSFDIVMSIYDLRKIITLQLDNFYSLLYVNQHQLSFVKEYMNIRSTIKNPEGSTLKSPDEFILYEYILIMQNRAPDIDEQVLLNNVSNTFRRLIITKYNCDRTSVFTVASSINNYKIMKYLLTIDPYECQIIHILHNKQYKILKYILLHTDLIKRQQIHNDILIPIVLSDDIVAFDIAAGCYKNSLDYYKNLARKLNKRLILRALEEASFEEESFEEM